MTGFTWKLIMKWIEHCFDPTYFFRGIIMDKNENTFSQGDIYQLIEDFCSYMIKVIGKKVKNDDELIELVVMAGLSAYSLNSMNLGIEAPPGEGKTYSAVESLEIFPKQDKIFLGDLSPKALVHERGKLINSNFEPVSHRIVELESKLIETKEKKEKEKIKKEINKIKWNSSYLVDLSGKILLFLESPNIETWKMLRPILSHDVWTTTYKMTEQVAGKHVTKTVYIMGWPAVIYTKAEKEKDEIWDQIKSRFIIVSPNMSQEKYKAGIQVSSQRQLIPKSPEVLKQTNDTYKNCKGYILALKEELKRLLGPYNKLIKNGPDGVIKDISLFWCPFLKQLEEIFPNENGQNMRDYNTFISIMQMSALLNMLNRPFIKGESGGTGYIVITMNDFRTAKKIFNRGTVKLKTGQQYLDFYENVILPLWHEKEEDPENDELIVKEIGDYCRKNYRDLTDQTIRENYLKPLKELGFMSLTKGSSRGGGYRWKALKNSFDSFIESEPKFSFKNYTDARKLLDNSLIIESINIININKFLTETDKFNTSSQSLNISKAFFNKDMEYLDGIEDETLYNRIVMSQKTTNILLPKYETKESVTS